MCIVYNSQFTSTFCTSTELSILQDLKDKTCTSLKVTVANRCMLRTCCLRDSRKNYKGQMRLSVYTSLKTFA